jgi:hypothetical protein
MAYQFISIAPKTAAMQVVTDSNSEYSKGVTQEIALAMSAPELLEALSFYRAICGNTAYQVSRESAQAAYTLATAAINKATGSAA